MNNYAGLSDSQLLQLCSEDDQLAFSEIFNRYWEKLLSIGYYHSGNKQAAEEIVNDVLVGIWGNRKSLVIRSLSAYLATAVKFSVFKVLLREKRQKELLNGKAETEDITYDHDKIEARFLQDYLNGIVETMPEKSRLIFKYSRQQGLSVGEIADKTALSPKAVEYHITKVLKALRIALEKLNLFLMMIILW